MRRRSTLVAQAGMLAVLCTLDNAPLRAEPVDCRRAIAVDELAICNSRDLLIMDGELDRAYRAARVRWTASMSNSVRVMHEAWIKERRKCAADQKCLMTRIVEEIEALDRMRPSSPTWLLDASKEKAAK